MTTPPTGEPAVFDLYVLRPGELSLGVPRDMEDAVVAALKSNAQAVGAVHYRIQESADLLPMASLLLGSVADVAALVQILLSIRGSRPTGPRIRYRQRRSSTTFEADGFDADDVVRIVRALREDVPPRS